MRLTTCYRLARTNTFRLGSGKLFQKPKRKASEAGPEFGGNMQNWEKGLRRLAVADEGCSFCQVDQAGAEALITAYLCPPGRYRDLFINNIKPHTWLGLVFRETWQREHPYIDELAKMPIAELKLDARWKAFESSIKKSDSNPPATRHYYHYKMTAHSANYGIEKSTFVENLLAKSGGQLALSPAQGDVLLRAYRDIAFPEIHAFHRMIESKLERDGELRNLFGYPRRFRSLKQDLKEALAYVPQSTVGCITNIAATRFCDYTIDTGKMAWILLNNCHDSALIQCPDNEIEDAAKKLHEFMCQDLVAPRGEKFKMKAECAIGKNWGAFHETENPMGLKEFKI